MVRVARLDQTKKDPSPPLIGIRRRVLLFGARFTGRLKPT
ncbi:hypothetical protein SEA_MULCHROOM_9 [Streptomyces phage Mulchroom]|nr:hypothetical protein SEA_MULCHROOM_9 [Streptomyces phage Mulchroom]